MNALWLFVAVSPLLAAAAVLAVVVVIALFRARPEDIPAVMLTFVTGFTRLVERIRPTLSQHSPAPVERAEATGQEGESA